MRFECMRSAVLALIAMLALGACGDRRNDREPQVRVFAAASLIDVLEGIGEDWQAEGHPAPVFSFGPTSQLAVQLRQGAEADVFISADEAWMDELERAGLINPATRANIASNNLVIVAPPERAGAVQLAELGALVGDGKLVMAEGSVPAGRYAREALEATGLWPDVEEMAVYAPDVRAALRFVELGEAMAGIVYRTDAIAAGDRVAIVAEFPPTSHTPIRYPAAAIADGSGDAFQAFLFGKMAKARFAELGFGME